MYSRIAVVLIALLIGLPGLGWAEGDAAAPIRELSDRLIEVMKQGSALGFQGRVDKLRPTVTSAYDMTAMTKSTLGLAAAKLSPEETSQLAEAYGRYSVATYADQFDSWDGERIEVGEPRPAANGLTLVPSKIIPKSGQAVEIDYLMHEDGGHWRIVDVLLEGSTSQVAVRRSEFVPIFRREGVAALIGQLDSKSAALGKK